MRALLVTARENAALRGRVLERTYDRIWVCVGQSWEGLQKYKFSLGLMFSESGSSSLDWVLNKSCLQRGYVRVIRKLQSVKKQQSFILAEKGCLVFCGCFPVIWFCLVLSWLQSDLVGCGCSVRWFMSWRRTA